MDTAEPILRVLLIEDDEDDFILASDLLKAGLNIPHEVTWSRRLEEALLNPELSCNQVDVILLDLSLPDSQGWETFRKVHDVAPDVPLILLTDLVDEGIGVRAVKAGAQDYLIKSHISHNRLPTAVRYAVERKRTEETLRSYQDHLEELVIRKTAEIQDANSQLRSTNEQLVREIAEKEATQARLRATLADLERSNADLEQFAYAASHDLQEPLRTISASVQLLTKKNHGHLDAESEALIRHAVEGTKRMQSLIHSLLVYARAGSDGHAYQDVNCETLLRRALENLKARIEGSHAQITHDPLPRIMANPEQIETLLLNLVGNAIKFCEQMTPEVHISCRNKGEFFEFSVRDNGIGIDPEHHTRIFEIFKRIHPPDKYPGNGMGLSFCKRIVESHGGKIRVESEEGKGATFFFTLPARRAPL